MPKAPFAVQCPNCNAKFKMGDQRLIGKKKKCPKCQVPFLIEPAGAKGGEDEDDPFAFLDEHLGNEAQEDWTARGTLPPRRSTHRPVKKRRPAEEEELDDEDAPKAKRRSRQAEAEPKKKNVLLYVMMAVIPLMLVGLGAMVYLIVPESTFAGLGLGGGEFEMPTEYEVWKRKSSVFQFEYPAGWESKGSSEKALVQSGSIEIRAELSDSSLFNMDLAGGPVPRGPDGAAAHLPVDDIHQVWKKKVEEQYSDYSEFDKGRVENMPENSRYSEFTYSNFWGTQRRGYRLSVMYGNTVQLRITLECNADQFEKVKPVFDEVMTTFEPKAMGR